MGITVLEAGRVGEHTGTVGINIVGISDLLMADGPQQPAPPSRGAKRIGSNSGARLRGFVRSG